MNNEIILPTCIVYHRKPLKRKIFEYGTNRELQHKEYKYKKIYKNIAFSTGDIMWLEMVASHNLRILKKLSPAGYKRAVK